MEFADESCCMMHDAPNQMGNASERGELRHQMTALLPGVPLDNSQGALRLALLVYGFLTVPQLGLDEDIISALGPLHLCPYHAVKDQPRFKGDSR